MIDTVKTVLLHPAFIAFATTVLTLIGKEPISHYFGKTFLIFKLATEHNYEERRKVKNTLSKHKIHILNACELLNHRLINLTKYNTEKAHFMDGKFLPNEERDYYFSSLIYRFAHVYSRIELCERELVLLDSTIASKEDLEFVKYLRVFREVLSDTTLTRNLQENPGQKRDHIYRGRVDQISRSLIESNEEICNETKFTKLFDQYLPELMPLCNFLDSISPEEERCRWDRLQSFHYLIILLLNSYGYDSQTTSKSKFTRLLTEHRESRVLDSFVFILDRAKLHEQKEVKKFKKLLEEIALNKSGLKTASTQVTRRNPMHIISKTLIGLVALIHSYILVFEMFLWETRGPKVFTSFPTDLFAPTKILAANQGLYNGFLAAGLFWALLFIKDTRWKRNVAYFFLGCVAVAGVYGAATASQNILFVQTVPAVLGLLSLKFLKKS